MNILTSSLSSDSGYLDETWYFEFKSSIQHLARDFQDMRTTDSDEIFSPDIWKQALPLVSRYIPEKYFLSSNCDILEDIEQILQFFSHIRSLFPKITHTQHSRIMNTLQSCITDSMIPPDFSSIFTNILTQFFDISPTQRIVQDIPKQIQFIF